MDRARIMELRSEAATELAGARAREDRLRSLEAARTEAEARAAAHAADAEITRMQVRWGQWFGTGEERERPTPSLPDAEALMHRLDASLSQVQ
jgi:hypothetical protein